MKKILGITLIILAAILYLAGLGAMAKEVGYSLRGLLFTFNEPRLLVSFIAFGVGALSPAMITHLIGHLLLRSAKKEVPDSVHAIQKPTLYYTPSAMSRKDVRQWAMLMALVREQYAAMRKHVNGRLGAWGKARFPVRKEKIDKLLTELLQRKVKSHGNYALEALYDDLINIENNKQKWNNATVEEIKFVRNILDGFPRSSRRVEFHTAQNSNRYKVDPTISQVNKPHSASATISIPEEDDWEEDTWAQKNERLYRAQRVAGRKTERRRAEDEINTSKRRFSDEPGGTVVFIIIILLPFIVFVLRSCQ